MIEVRKLLESLPYSQTVKDIGSLIRRYNFDIVAEVGDVGSGYQFSSRKGKEESFKLKIEELEREKEIIEIQKDGCQSSIVYKDLASTEERIDDEICGLKLELADLEWDKLSKALILRIRRGDLNFINEYDLRAYANNHSRERERKERERLEKELDLMREDLNSNQFRFKELEVTEKIKKLRKLRFREISSRYLECLNLIDGDYFSAKQHKVLRRLRDLVVEFTENPLVVERLNVKLGGISLGMPGAGYTVNRVESSFKFWRK